MYRGRIPGFAALLGLAFATAASAQTNRPRPPAPPATLGLPHGFLDLQTPGFTLRLVKDSQTVAALRPQGAGAFDFTPADRLERRAADGYYHLGDLTFRARPNGVDAWQDYSTAAKRQPVTALPASGSTLAAADLRATLPADCPVQVIRRWKVDRNRLVLLFEVKNTGTRSVQLGSLGIPMPFNNHITDRSLPEAHEVCSFADPYIGEEAGYLQVTRLSGQGPTLVVAPFGRTPFEAYRLLNEPTRPNQTFEGTMEWMVHSQAHAETEWKGVEQWNAPTSTILTPGATRTYGVTFLLSDSIRNVEKTLSNHGRPVAVGIPGYVLPTDQNGRLFLNYPRRVREITVEPKGALDIVPERPTRRGWKAYRLRGLGWGRARVNVVYDDGLKQSVSYYITKPAGQTVSDLGHFLTTKQWFNDPADPFRRSPSVISYDREADRQVVQDSRVWIAGLGDEGGSGSWLAAAMKQFGQPNPVEVAKYESFIDGVLWGGLQFKDGPNKYGVRKSLFYYEPALIPGFTYDPNRNWTSWTSWNLKATEDIGRGYNYPHVVAAYWSMYRVARNHPGLVKNHDWNWYLEQAYQTIRFMTDKLPNGRPRVWYVDLGLMEGTIFLQVLDDLKREGWTEKAADVETRMKARADKWKGETYPFGSEMAWDSTGQEEVYAWCRYFGYDDKALVSLNSILAYMPTLPHWGYNGNARRYWDFLYGGKLSRIERQIHHYGSGLNAIPVLTHYRAHPDDFHLLRVGYGGTMGALSNIDRDGFASAAFHSFPSTLKWDAYSGDYGPNFLGHALNTATYLVDHPEFGWQAFGGNVSREGNRVRLDPRDSFRKRVYLAPLGLYLTLDAGTFERVEYDLKTRTVRVGLSPARSDSPTALLRIEQPAKITGIGSYRPSVNLKEERAGYIVPLGRETTWVELRP
ncbi:MAG: DUF5695 domain-containing protein [Fimbriimonas sp.]